VSIAKTRQYSEALRELIREVGLEALVDLLVESEQFSVDDFADQLAESAGQSGASPLSRKQHENVERFLGRSCDEAEARQRASRYKDVIDVSERLLARVIHGIHMTQRATESTICFRPFPGGASRIQCGEVVLSRNDKQRLCPVLLTSTNRDEYSCRKYRFPQILPRIIPYLTYAERLAK
jgi:hypothetical protein